MHPIFALAEVVVAQQLSFCSWLPTGSYVCFYDYCHIQSYFHFLSFALSLTFFHYYLKVVIFLSCFLHFCWRFLFFFFFSFNFLSFCFVFDSFFNFLVKVVISPALLYICVGDLLAFLPYRQFGKMPSTPRQCLEVSDEMYNCFLRSVK